MAVKEAGDQQQLTPELLPPVACGALRSQIGHPAVPYPYIRLGQQPAVRLGVTVSRLRSVNVLICWVVAAVVVSYVGIINFIGLVAPHIVRRFLGNNYCYLIPGSALMGAVLLLLGDLVARNVVAPVVLPIGAITSFLGAPLFLYLLFKGRNRS